MKRLPQLISHWSNGWSAQSEYLTACFRFLSATDGPILECGSGLTTLVAAAIGKSVNQEREIWTLEHHAEWAKTVQLRLDKFKLNNVNLITSSINNYHEGFAWYSPPLDTMPENFSMVICDGPPSDTKGGRVGLLPVCGDKLADNCIILLDDFGRQDERETAQYWCNNYGFEIVEEMSGTTFGFLQKTSTK